MVILTKRGQGPRKEGQSSQRTCKVGYYLPDAAKRPGGSPWTKDAEPIFPEKPPPPAHWTKDMRGFI